MSGDKIADLDAAMDEARRVVLAAAYLMNAHGCPKGCAHLSAMVNVYSELGRIMNALEDAPCEPAGVVPT